MAKYFCGYADQSVYDFGLKYGTGFGFTMEQLTIFHLNAYYHKDTVEIAEILGQRREVVRRKLVTVLRELLKQQRLFEKAGIDG